MPITPAPQSGKGFPVSNEGTPFNKTLATTDTVEDLVTVPTGKKGRRISLVNDGPGAVALAFDGDATASDLVIKEGEAFSEWDLELSTKLSFINVVTGETPTVRGVLWSGPT